MLNKVLMPYDAESTASSPENSDHFFGSLAGLRQLAGEARACWMGQRVSMAAMAMAKPEVSDVVLVGTIILYSYTHGDFLGVSDYELVHGTP